MTKKTLFFIFFIFLLSTGAYSQSVLGTWRTIDDETGDAKSHVEFYMQDGKLFGKVTKLLRKESQGKVCEKCSGYRKNQPILGMVILENMTQSGDTWRGGTILDPEKGKTYTCKLWLDKNNPDKLHLRGYIGPFYRTQNWYRVK